MPTMRYLDGVLQKTTTNGTGDLTINTSGGGNFRSFLDAVNAGDFTWGEWIFYIVEDDDGREWGYAQVIEAGPTLKRSTGTIIASTNAGAAIDCAGAGLTRIFPGIPDEWNLTIQDLAKNGGIIATTDFENVFEEDNTFEANVQIDLNLTVDGNTGIGGTLEVDGNATMSGTIYHTKIDTGAEGPNEEAYLDSSSPAASDVIKRWRQYAKDSGGNKTLFSEFLSYVVDPTNGSEDAQFLFRAMAAGAFADALTFGSAGLATGGLTPQGAGTGNFTALYVNSVLQTAQTRQAAYIGDVTTSPSGGAAVFLVDPGATGFHYNTITGASWDNTNNRVTLPAGQFHVNVYFVYTAGTATSISWMLYDVTHSAALRPGANFLQLGTTSRQVGDFFEFTLAGSSVLEMRITTSGAGGTATISEFRIEFVRVG